MSQYYYQEVSNYFGINTVKELIHNRFQKFRISYGAADNYLCRLIFAKCWTYFDCTVYTFCFFSWLPFFDGEIKLYIKLKTEKDTRFDGQDDMLPISCSVSVTAYCLHTLLPGRFYTGRV